MTPAIDDADKRDQEIRIRVSQRELALFKELAVEDGMSLSAWCLERLIPVLEERRGYVDTARRKAPRRPNRKRKEGHQS